MAPVAMMNMDLEGQGEELLTVVRNYATPQEWGAWLRVPLSGAAAEGNIGLVDSLVAAGADAGPGTREVSIHSFVDVHTNECVSKSIVIHAHSFVCLFFSSSFFPFLVLRRTRVAAAQQWTERFPCSSLCSAVPVVRSRCGLGSTRRSSRIIPYVLCVCSLPHVTSSTFDSRAYSGEKKRLNTTIH